MPIIVQRLVTTPRRDDVIVDKGGVPSERFIGFLEDLTKKYEGTNSDLIDIAGTEQVVVSGSYTSNGNQNIICTGPSTIILQSIDLKNGQKVTVIRVNGLVQIQSAIPISGIIQPLNLTRDKTALDFLYEETTNTWYIN